MSTARSWSSCLDSFAEHLADQRQALEQGEVERISAFVPAPDLGPLPPALAPRARLLAAQSQALIEVASDARALMAAAIAELERPARAARPAYIDSMA